ncbi:MAG: hypothetical protein ACI86C_000291 [Candidatus Latescibacterota bacterium]|jgi:hypothetical protein
MKKIAGILSLFLALGLIYYSFYSLMPRNSAPASSAPTEFSAERALIPLKEITKVPHFHGSDAHADVRNYLENQLQNLGLTTEIQDDFILNQKWGAIDKPKNILGYLEGTGDGKALMLLSHYDSAKTPSFGASDAGSGVVTILESLRAYLASGKTPTNDIVVLFSDAEEIGLDGAKLFVNRHPKAKEIGLVLNFEARGSGGPSNMILETNGGNANLIKAFVDANPEFPVASSLMYSIYKMLPNDTDSTVFREDADIDSFFFAFIDDHFDYHTANDNFENLDRNTLQHQGSYLLPLIHYFADADLSELKAQEDYVYVNAPLVKMIIYPFAWIFPMLIIAFLTFVILVFYGIKKGRLKARAIGKGFLAFVFPLLISGALGYLGWMLLKMIYPHYNEIQHGFTYNGHWYIAFFVMLTLAITFKVYRRFNMKTQVASFYVAPLFFWILINTGVAFALKGAAYWIIPVFFGLLSFWVLIRQEKPSLLLLTLLAAPALFLFAPLIQFFPVGLGLKMLLISCIFTVLTFGLVLPVLGAYRWKNIFAIACALFALIFMTIAHFKSDFTEERQKPNSLNYYQDADTKEAYWVTYDKILDPWTKGYLGDNPKEAKEYVSNAAGSKYNSGYSYAAKAPYKAVALFETVLNKDTIWENLRHITLTILPRRNVHEISLYADKDIPFSNMTFNGQRVSSDTTNNRFFNRKHNGLLRYSVSGNDSLELSYSVPKDKPVAIKVAEYSFDLLTHQDFTINQRPAHTMPKPFVNTDAIVTYRTIHVDKLSKPLKLQDSLAEIPTLNE